jgi:hypothetical protein
MLLGLIVLVVGAGVIGASGAFSSVQAERTMDIDTTGDGSALLQLSGNDDTIAGTAQSGGVDVLEIANSEINEDAQTIFAGAFTITNGGNDNVDELYFRENGSVAPGGPVDFVQSGGSSLVGSSNAVSLGAQGDSVEIDVVIDTTGSTSSANLPNSGTVTIVANNTADLS